MNQGNTTVIITLVGILAMVGALLLLPKLVNNNSIAQDGSKLPCLLPNLPQVVHLHPKLKIIVDGKEEVMPAEIGLEGACHRPLHTHDADNVIHVESQVVRDYTLEEFFIVWKRPISRDGYIVTMTVDDQPSDEFGQHILKDNEQIVLDYKKIEQEK